MTRVEMAAMLGGRTQELHHWPVSLEHYELLVYGWVIDCSARCMVVGIALSDIEHASRRCHVAYGPTTLQPSIAACMVRLARVEAGQVVADPMCGSGTIPVEAALAHPDSVIIASDLYAQCICNTAANVAAFAAGRNIAILHSCATALPLRAGSVQRIIVDLPWGQRCVSGLGTVSHSQHAGVRIHARCRSCTRSCFVSLLACCAQRGGWCVSRSTRPS
jgi:23S rRNA G2445 N2-methylase RlmL